MCNGGRYSPSAYCGLHWGIVMTTSVRVGILNRGDGMHASWINPENITAIGEGVNCTVAQKPEIMSTAH